MQKRLALFVLLATLFALILISRPAHAAVGDITVTANPQTEDVAEFETLAEAFSAINDGSIKDTVSAGESGYTVTIANSVSEQETATLDAASENVTLDIKAHIQCAHNANGVIVKAGTLTIVGGSSCSVNGSGSVPPFLVVDGEKAIANWNNSANSALRLMVNAGKLNVQSAIGRVIMNGPGVANIEKDVPAYYELKVTGGTVNVAGDVSEATIDPFTAGTINILDGGKASSVAIGEDATLTLSGGSVESVTSMATSSTLNLSGGTLKTPIQEVSSGTVNVNTAEPAGLKSPVTISGGTINVLTETDTEYFVNQDGTLNVGDSGKTGKTKSVVVNGGTLSVAAGSTIDGGDKSAVTANSGKVTIEGTVTNSSANDATVDVSGTADVSVNGNSAIVENAQSGTSPAISVDANAAGASVTVGDNTGTTPAIKGSIFNNAGNADMPCKVVVNSGSVSGDIINNGIGADTQVGSSDFASKPTVAGTYKNKKGNATLYGATGVDGSDVKVEGEIVKETNTPPIEPDPDPEPEPEPQPQPTPVPTPKPAPEKVLSTVATKVQKAISAYASATYSDNGLKWEITIDNSEVSLSSFAKDFVAEIIKSLSTSTVRTISSGNFKLILPTTAVKRESFAMNVLSAVVGESQEETLAGLYGKAINFEFKTSAGKVLTLSIDFSPAPEPEVEYVSMYRLYNPYTTEHLYTTDESEWRACIDAGWQNETGEEPLKLLTKSDTTVFRLYNTWTGEHHYTAEANEKNVLVENGWNYEGVAFYAADSNDGLPVYRLYRGDANPGAHHFTSDTNERDILSGNDWTLEGIAWYLPSL